MLPPIYQQQQQQNEFNCGTNNQMCSMMMQTSSDCLKSTSVQNMSPPFRDFPAQLNTSGKSSQLKETHSALVKILESAPIPSNTSTTSATTMTVPPFTKSTTILLSSLPQSQPPKSSSSSTTLTSFSTTTTSATATMVAVSAAPTMLLVNQTNQQNTYHRKRNKHLNTISTHCDMDKSSDEEVGCNSNSSASSNASEAEIICPWKKTRIAREWHQSQKMDENLMEHRPPTIVNVPTINLNM